MEYDRVVQVRLYPSAGGKPFVGSGYLVAPRLVLTAAHVLGDGADHPDAGRVTVQAPVSVSGGLPTRPEIEAQVAWYRRTLTVDAALLALDSDDSSALAPDSDAAVPLDQRWGYLIGSRPYQVSLTGFPRMQRDGDQRSARQLDGHITAGNQAVDGRFEVASSDPTRPLVNGAGPGVTRWSGMSGAAVLAADADGDLLCGVARHDLQGDGGTILTATPIRSLLADPAFLDVLSAHGVGARAEPIEPARLLAPVTSPPVSGSPTALLRADVEAVAFTGRERELEGLLAWCRGEPQGVSVRVLAGPSGQGKSRLARHLAMLMETEGWVSGHLRAEVTDFELPEGFPGFDALRTELPLLLVVDYAETRPNRVRALLTQLSGNRHRVRVLLLARSDGPWRTEAHGAIARVRDLLNMAEVSELSALYGTTGPDGVEPARLVPLRREAFEHAARSLAAMLPLVPGLDAADWPAIAAGLPAPRDLGESRYENVLTMQLAALTGLLQHGPAPVPAQASTPTEKILLDHEKRFWAGSAASPTFRLDALPGTTLDAAVAAAVLCGAADHAEAEHALSAVTGLTTQQIPSVAGWLAQLYPATPGRLWASLQPDRVGEYHAVAVLTAPVKTLDTSRLLTGAASGQQAQFVIVLARAAIAAYNAGRFRDTERIVALVNGVVSTTVLDHNAMRAAVDALPYPNRVINPIALRLAGLLVEAETRMVAENPGADETGLAISLGNLGVLLSEAGMRAEALAAAEQAVEIRRRLAADNPTLHEPSLAGALSNLGNNLSLSGRRAEALAVTEQAVEIYRRQAADNPAAHERDLASALSNFGGHLAQAGRRAEALIAAEQAAEIRRRQAADNPAIHEPELASALHNLGNHLSQVGRHNEALTTAEQAAEIYGRLAAENPAAYEPDLASALSNLGSQLARAGRRAEALIATERAVDIRRRLAADNPASYEPALAAALSNLGTRLSQAGRLSEALTVTGQALEIRRRLAADNPAAHEGDLARSLSKLGSNLSQAGRHAEALTAEQQAVEIRRRLADDSPAAHEPDLASSLASLGIRLSRTGRPAEALTATEQAVEIYRRLAADNPAAHQPALAVALSNLGIRLSQAGRPDEALSAEQQAVQIRSRLAADNPEAYEPEFASSLSNLSNRLVQVGRLSEALTAVRQAVEIRRRLATTDPGAYEPDLAGSLTNLGNHLSRAGQPAEALSASQQAVEIRRRLAANNPAAHEPELGRALSNLGVRLSQADRHAEALTVTEEAVAIRRRLTADDAAVHEPGLAASLSNLGIRLAQAHRHAEALTVTEEAVEIYRRVAATSPASHEPGLASSLSNLAVCLAQADRLTEALTAEQQAIDIRRRLAANNPAAHELDLAGSLSNLASWLARADRPGEALTATQQAVEIRRRLAAENAAYEPLLARSLAGLVNRLLQVRRAVEARTVIEQTLGIYRHLAVENPASYEPDLAAHLAVKAVLWTDQDSATALAASAEASSLLRKHILATPALAGLLRSVLDVQAQVLDSAGRSQEAQQVRASAANLPQADTPPGA